MSNVPVLLSITEPDFKGGAPANTPTEPARKPLAKPKMEDKALSQRQHRKSIPAAVLWVSGAGSQAKGKVGLSGPAGKPRAFEGWSVCQARQQDHPPTRVPHTGILVPACPKALHSPAWLDPPQHTGPTKLTSHRQPTPAKTAARLGQLSRKTAPAQRMRLRSCLAGQSGRAVGTKPHPLDARHAQLAVLHVPRDPVVFKSRVGRDLSDCA